MVARAQESEFEQFWEAFPSKCGKKAALRAWQKATDRPSIAIILQVIEEARRSERWQKGFIPNPATWLNQGRWADVIAPPAVKLSRPKALQPVPPMATQGEPCPPEVAARLAKMLGRETFSWPAAEVVA